MRIPLVATALLLLAACTTPTASAPQSDGAGDALAQVGRWMLQGATDAHGNRIDAAFPHGGAVHVLVFADGTVSLEGGCNRIGGHYRMDAQGRLVVDTLLSTRRGCADTPLMGADGAVSDLIQGTSEWRIAESWPEQLFLEHAGGARSHWVAMR